MLKRLKSTILLSTTAIIWGLSFVAQYQSTATISPLLFTTTRFFLGALSLIPIILIFERDFSDKQKIKNTLKYGLITGVAITAATMLQQTGINITQSAGKAGLITGLYIIIVPIFCKIFFKKKPTVFVNIGAMLALVGLYFLLFYGEEPNFNIGDLLIFCGSMCWATHIIFIDKFSSKVDPLKFSFVQYIFCSFVALILTLIFESFSIDSIILSSGAILYCGIGSVGVAFTLQVLGQKDEDPTYCSIILSTESLFAAIGELVFLHTPITIAGFVGCILIFGGILVSQFKVKNNE